MTVYKHLLIIDDGAVIENRLFQTSAERAEVFVTMAKDGEIGSLDGSRVTEAIDEADEEAGTGDYDEGVHPRTPVPEDYVDMLRELLADHGFDVYFDDLLAPDDIIASDTAEPAVSAL